MKKETHITRGRGEIERIGNVIKETFDGFGVAVELVEAKEGIHLFEFHLRTIKPTRMRAMKSFEDDLRYALGVNKIEILAPIPDKPLIGVIVPKPELPDVYSWKEYVFPQELKKLPSLQIPLGVMEFGEELSINFANSPHVLIGGSTGSGKSSLLHSVINSFIARYAPDRFRLILIDPKLVELTLYNGIPHLLTDVIYEAKKAVFAIKWAIKEMDRRLSILQESKVYNVSSYHKKFDGKKQLSDEPMPYIFIIIDEISDLMSAFPNETESAIVCLIQKSRAVGIHVIISTARPSVNVVTGYMKANIPTRIAFQVSSQVDSRVILDQMGAEKLQGKGDLLVLGYEEPQPIRLQAYYISDTEVSEIVSGYKKKKDNSSKSALELSGDLIFATDNEDDEDELFEEAKEIAIQLGKISTSVLQRKLRIGYGRAARLIDILEEKGVVGPAEGSTPRKVIN